MAGSFTTTGSYSNLTRLELEQLRKADFFAGSKALTVGDSALLPEGIIGKGNINAEPYLTGPNVLLDDVYSLTPVTTPGSYLGTLTQVYGTPSDSVTWYGPTQKAIGTTGVTSAVVVGTTDVTAAGLYGLGGTLNGLTLILNVDGGGALTLNLNGATNAESLPFLLAAIQALWPALSAVQGGAAGNQLVLAEPSGGSTIVVGAGTANALLGLTAGSTGGATNEFRDANASFAAAGVLAGDLLLVKDNTHTGVGPKNMQAVGTVTAVTATQLTVAFINAPNNAPTTQLGLDAFSYAYVVVRPGVTQLFAVPGSGPTGKEQTFLAVIPTSTLHTNLSPSLNAINADRVKSLVPGQYTHDTAIDRADGVYAAPAPRVALDKLGYRIVLYPSAGAGGPDLTLPITSLNPILDPAIPAGDQRFTLDAKAGVIRFSCAPQPGSDINPNSFVNATTGRLDLYAVFWAVDQTLTAGAARSLYAPRNTAIRAAVASKLSWDGTGWSTGTFSSATQSGGAIGSDDILRLYDAETVANAATNGGPYVPLTSASANNGDQIIRVMDRAATDTFTTLTVASNGFSLPQPDIFVASTAAFPVQGLLQVVTDEPVPQYVLYTNKTATSFTGCTGGLGKMATGGNVFAAAPSLLRTTNARYYCSVGNGTTSFGDFNGLHAIQAALAFIEGIGVSAATMVLKNGNFAPGTMLDIGALGALDLSIIGQGTASTVIQPPDTNPITIRVRAGSTLNIKGVRVISTTTAGHYSLQVTDTGRCWAEDCTFTSVDAVSLSSGSGTSASFKRCLITGTSNEAGVTIEGGNSTNCDLVVVDDSTFNMSGTQPPFRFRALAGPVGTIAGLRCTRSLFTLNVTTNTGGGTFGNLTENVGLVDLVPSGQDARAKTRAVVTGIQDMTVGALYGGGGSLDGKPSTLDVNGGGATTLNLVGATNASSFAALTAAIQALWPAITVSLDGLNHLVLTDTTAGSPNYLQVHVSTGGAAMGLTPGVTYATGSALGATVQECSFEQCTINTPNAPFAGDVNVLLHLVPRGNGATGDVNGNGPFLQIQHFKLKSCRLTASLGDPSAVPGTLQTIPFSAVNGAAHFEMDDCVFTMIPSAAFVEAVIPDDTAFDYTGTGTPPSIERFGYVAISCDKVTAKKIVCQGFPQIASIGDLSIRTRDIDVDDVILQQWTDGGLGSTPSHRLIFEAISGNYSGGSIHNVKMTGQQAAAGAWATSGGGLMALLEWDALADRHLVVSGGRIAKFTIAGTTPIGSWAGMRVKSASVIAGIHIDDYYIDSARYGIYIGTGAQSIDDVSITHCNTCNLGSGGLGKGIWIYVNSIDPKGVRIDNNSANNNVEEGILVDADLLGTGSWTGNVWLTDNNAWGNAGSVTQIMLNARTITTIRSTASNNACNTANMRLLKAGAAYNPDPSLAEHLRGWQTIGSLFAYANGGVMLFNDATFVNV